MTRRSLLLPALLAACGGGDDITKPPPPPPEVTGIVITNVSPHTIDHLYLRPCGSVAFDKSLTRPSIAANAADTIETAPGCYDAAGTANGELVVNLKALQVVDEKSTAVSVDAQAFQPFPETHACGSADLPSDALVGFHGGYFVLDGLDSPDADAVLRSEGAAQNAFWVIPTIIYGMADDLVPNAANAHASCGPTGSETPPGCLDGHIAFGNAFYSTHIQKHGLPAIWGTLAHEFGHRVQQTQPWWNDPRYTVQVGGLTNHTVVKELEADGLSGYYAVLGKGASQGDIDALYTHMYDIGSNMWTDPNWHGTQYQRYAASYVGVGVARYELANQVHFNYAQLHESFVTVILTDILQNPDGPAATVATSSDPMVQEVLTWLPRQKFREMALGRRRW
jgi:hypothetical protein